MSAEESISITVTGATIAECRQRAKADLDAFCGGEIWRWGNVTYAPLLRHSTEGVVRWEGCFTAWIIDEEAIEAT